MLVFNFICPTEQNASHQSLETLRIVQLGFETRFQTELFSPVAGSKCLRKNYTSFFPCFRQLVNPGAHIVQNPNTTWVFFTIDNAFGTVSTKFGAQFSLEWFAGQAIADLIDIACLKLQSNYLYT